MKGLEIVEGKISGAFRSCYMSHFDAVSIWLESSPGHNFHYVRYSFFFIISLFILVARPKPPFDSLSPFLAI